MILFPNAKINLGLNILARRADGYHDIATVFYPIGWRDALEVVPSRESETGCRLHLSGMPVDAPVEDNLVVRAYCLLSEMHPLPGVEVYLHKVIPYGAGLGGGSSDATFMMLLLRDLFSIPVRNDELAASVVHLGADCPFFLYNRPMLAEGIGDRLSPVEVSLRGYSLVLVKSQVSVSTAEAYSSVTLSRPEKPLSEILSFPVEKWREMLGNDFERSVFAQYPLLSHIKQQLYDLGAIYASLSGSGSALYGLFRLVPEEVERFFPHCQVWTGECAY
ncbi:MAG: 4-(cytidine 5'-diphospho)-2-C-methyl-D-erythritol kinase [Porphyromonadaceae bacterium]|nr:4-(cytidine 5'-diphospho)-2-C-methyl-D-erythritol kinase [Porphyromonadaceae bacterium]